MSQVAAAPFSSLSGRHFEQPCPIRDVLDRIGDQWTFLVLGALGGGTKRFSELAREIDDISRQMLSRTLRRLEQDGLVKRTVFAQVPPRVDYELTPLGRSFLGPLEALVNWADENHGAIVDARQHFAERG
ncbi:winged helix-turn-helix transcriptional regulator [Aureimonas mangrovi]|uniref:winged helix-turn-helix transcriptional regulator n=1 Tax=Aureimonas mangrovi TaxID=2758041 RepID=UPI00163DCFCA|nr:helix-turn-helix domain-containing protein [Aureimonas mangrovi]